LPVTMTKPGHLEKVVSVVWYDHTQPDHTQPTKAECGQIRELPKTYAEKFDDF
jgi:hypothetical protein